MFTVSFYSHTVNFFVHHKIIFIHSKLFQKWYNWKDDYKRHEKGLLYIHKKNLTVNKKVYRQHLKCSSFWKSLPSTFQVYQFCKSLRYQKKVCRCKFSFTVNKIVYRMLFKVIVNYYCLRWCKSTFLYLVVPQTSLPVSKNISVWT